MLVTLGIILSPFSLGSMSSHLKPFKSSDSASPAPSASPSSASPSIQLPDALPRPRLRAIDILKRLPSGGSDASVHPSSPALPVSMISSSQPACNLDTPMSTIPPINARGHSISYSKCLLAPNHLNQRFQRFQRPNPTRRLVRSSDHPTDEAI